MLGGEIEGDGSAEVNRLSKIQDAEKGSIAFLSNPKYESHLYETRASAVIVSKDFQPKSSLETTLIKVEDPYSSFSRLLEEYSRMLHSQKQGVEEPAFIGENTSTGEGIYRGAFSYVGSGVSIGQNVKIYPHAFVGDNTTIGDNCIIYAGAKIYEGTEIGDNCVIHSGAVIGSDGFGFAPQPDGSYKAIPQLGKVKLENNVSIGANTTIDCATFDSDYTLIKEGVKLDNLIQIAHNVEIGEHTVIAAQAGVSGSSKIGNNCMIGGQVGVSGHVEIIGKTSIAAQSGIMKSPKDEGAVLIGSPAFDHKQYLKCYVVFRKLPDLDQRLKELEEKVLNLRTV